MSQQAIAIQALQHVYLEALTKYDISSIYRQSAQLSGLFVPSASNAYFDQKVKLMIIGKGTRSWRNDFCAVKNQPDNVTADAINQAMTAHAKWL